MEEEKKEKGFVIKDRRLFDETGAVRGGEGAANAEEQKTAGAVGETPGTPEEKAASHPEETPLPEISFTGFVFSLSTTAMYHFGDFPDPVTKETRQNLAAAKQTIDILAILKKKTEGNLDEDEKQLLEGILYELQMRYVKEVAK